MFRARGRTRVLVRSLTQGEEDWLCWCLLAARGPFLFLDRALLGYGVHEHAATTAVARSRIQHLYALLELKIALFARSDSGWHGLRVLFSIFESLRMVLVEYLVGPGGEQCAAAQEWTGWGRWWGWRSWCRCPTAGSAGPAERCLPGPSLQAT